MDKTNPSGHEIKDLGACQPSAVTASPVLRTEPASSLGPDGRVPHGAMPGPWSASEMTMDKKSWASLNSDTLHIVQANWDGWAGDVVACVWSDDDHDEAATARLISAAPDLLEALRETMDVLLANDGLSSDPTNAQGWADLAAHEAYMQGHAALAKARGEA